MRDDEVIGWTMAGAVGAIGLVVLALFYVPELKPDEAVLACDRSGGVWSSEARDCAKSDSPLAGLAA